MSLDKIQWKHVNLYNYKLKDKDKNGMTIGIHEIEPGQFEVFVSVCNKKDSFCKKTGRIQATANPSVILPLKDIPTYLANHSSRLYKHWGVKTRFNYEVDQWKLWCFRFVGSK